jgi:hypothetical protein
MVKAYENYVESLKSVQSVGMRSGEDGFRQNAKYPKNQRLKNHRY